MFQSFCFGLFSIFSIFTFSLSLASAETTQSCASQLDAMGAFSKLWKSQAVAAADPLKLIDRLVKKFPHEIGAPGSAIRYGLGRALRQSLAEKVAGAKFLTAEKKADLLESLDKAIDEYQGQGGSPGGGGRDLGGGGGSERGGVPLDPVYDGPLVPDPRLIAEVEAFFKRPNFQACVGETALLLSISSLVSAAGAVIVNWEKYAGSGHGNFWKFLKGDLFSKELWKKAWADPEFQHIMTFNSILMTALGALSCMGDKNAGRNAMTAISFGASVFDQWRTGHWSLRQTLVDTLWIRYVSFFKTGKALHYSRAYAATGRAYPKLVEGALQTVSELIGAFGYPMASELSKKVWTKGEGYFTDAEALWRVLAAPPPAHR